MLSKLSRTILAAGAAVALAAVAAGHAAAKELRVMAWEGYADKDWVAEFEKKTGAKVNVVFVGTDDEIWAKIKGSEGKDFDVFAVNTAQLQRYIDDGLAIPHDLSKLPNQKAGLPRFADLSKVTGTTRDGKVYGIPYAFDSIGLIYDTEKVKPAPTSMSVLWDPKYKGKVLLYDNGEHNFSFTALTMGADNPFKLSPEQMDKAKAKLGDLKKNAIAFYSTADEAQQIYNTNDIALIWANYGQQQMKAMQKAGAKVGYINPEEGALTWLDTWAVTKGVQDFDLAEQWVNFLLDKKIGAQLSERTGFGNTSVALEGANPKDKLIWLEAVEDPTKRADVWNEIKAAREGVAGAGEGAVNETQRPLLELRALSKSYGAVPVLREVDLAIRDGEFLTLLGPSGSGKTTILRIIGGFAEPDGGSVLMDGTDIVRLPVNRRPFNTVFQDYALFPHMKVAANVAYGLRVRGTSSAETERRVAEVLDLVQLGGFRDRYPAELSGGQRQRVALARAIVCRPRLILLDEPLAALDVALRRQMQHFLKSIQREIRTTFLFVTHDQEEAITMSDRICVMDQGRILQAGSAEDLYYRPDSLFVARFFGDNNLVEGRLAAGGGREAVLDTAIGPVRARTDVQPPPGSAAFAMLRPEAIVVGPPGAPGALAGRIEFLEFGGASTLAGIRVGSGEGIALRARLPSSARGVGLAEGQAVSVSWDEADCRLLPP